MPRIVSKSVFKFDELSDCAKAKARDWFREGALDYDWWEHVYSDADQCAAILGIEISRKNRGTSPTIWFSGFFNQGDGACFEGSYNYAKGSTKAIRKHAPQDATLHRIADALMAIQRRYRYNLTANMDHRGHYYHSGCMRVGVDYGDLDLSVTAEDAITQCMRDFADWIYRQLEREHDWQLADEQVDDSIMANDYEFNENGSRA